MLNHPRTAHASKAPRVLNMCYYAVLSLTISRKRFGKVNLARLSTDLGMVERATNFSSATCKLSRTNKPSSESDTLERHTTGCAETEHVL